MRRYVARVNEELTKRGKNIFGDIVKEVLITAVLYEGLDILAQHEEYHARKAGAELIDLDYGDIIIKFTNGKTVKFTSSEWGDISTAGEFEEIV